MQFPYFYIFRQTGSIDFTAGTHTFEVDLDFEPEGVYTSLDESGFQVCGNSDSWVSVAISGQSVVITVHVATDAATLKWLAF